MASRRINAWRTISGNQHVVNRLPEGATQTFKGGTPVQLTNGLVVAWDGATLALGIAGIAYEGASNLAVAGAAETLTYGSVINQPSAVNIPLGAPMNDGMVGVEVAVDDTIFRAQVGPTQTVTLADVGDIYGLTIDTDGSWFVDKDKTGANAAVRIVAIDDYDERGVSFVFLPAVQGLLA